MVLKAEPYVKLGPDPKDTNLRARCGLDARSRQIVGGHLFRHNNSKVGDVKPAGKQEFRLLLKRTS